MEITKQKNTYSFIDDFSSTLDYNMNETAIILAAGHGKRIKSQKSKMLHKIWGVPTVERVYEACKDGIDHINTIIVVGIKAEDVVKVVGKKRNTVYAYQEEQNGTGHAVQVALEKIDEKLFNGNVFVLPGDMGLIDKETMNFFREEFMKTNSDMMVLTGIYNGEPMGNYYGRIIRVKEYDDKDNLSGNDFGKVIEIMEYKDILSLREGVPYKVNFKEKTYSYTKQELLNNNEFNSGVYAFQYKKLVEQVKNLSSNNVQNEIYITDLIALFNKAKYSVMAVSPIEQYVVMGFNNKSVLKEMENVARKRIYDKLKDIIEIDDPDDFFIHESVVENILAMDKQNIPLDISLGKGVYIGKGVKLNYNLTLKKNVYLNGNIFFGRNVIIWENVHLSTFENQEMKIGNYVEVLWGDIVKGNIEIGDYSRIESSVNMTGSDEFPLRVGKNVLIKGTSYLLGSIVEDGVYIEHSVLIKKRVEKLVKRDGTIQQIRFYLPMPEGIDAVEDL
jgi:bifunctional UDP-N-acetylglucosamine pyrophosphorylase / glucosamine-1-phosphate N-acetyltransferase